VEGTGWMIGPYLSTRLHDQIYLDLRAAWGQSSNDLTTDTATGSFGTTRWLVKGTLSGDWIAGAWRMTPSAELAYMNEHAAEFTDSTSTIIPAQDVATGRLQLGTEFGYRIGQNSGALIEPFVGLKGVWDFVNPNGAAGDIRARLQGGLNVTAPSGLSLRALASWDDVGSAYCGYTLQGTLRVPLH
jgi:outer membrane autotransporter protein